MYVERERKKERDISFKLIINKINICPSFANKKQINADTSLQSDAEDGEGGKGDDDEESSEAYEPSDEEEEVHLNIAPDVLYFQLSLSLSLLKAHIYIPQMFSLRELVGFFR